MTLTLPETTRTRAKPGPGPVPADLLRALDLRLARRTAGLVDGDHRAARLGRGSELAQIRPYVVGDDVRRIDWNATARQNELHVRVDVAERAVSSWLLLDVSPSMGSAPPCGARPTSSRASRSRSRTSRHAAGIASGPSRSAARARSPSHSDRAAAG